MPPHQNELDRLTALYADFSDAELLRMLEKATELTEVASHALDAELKRRRLVPDSPGAASPTAVSASALTAEDGLTRLMLFDDALTLKQAIKSLERRELPFALNELEGRADQPQAIEVRVLPAELTLARQALQEDLGLFPPAEGQAGDAELDDDVLLVVAQCESQAEADQAGKILAAAGIPFELQAPADEDSEGSEDFLVRVQAYHCEQALALLLADTDTD